MRVQMRTEISKLHQRLGGTMVYVTHDQTEAMTMGDRICVMKDGVIQQVATPLELYDRPCNKFVAGFIGTPPMNFVNGKIVKNEEAGLKFVSDGTGFEMNIPASMKSTLTNYEDKEVILGVRPEDLTVRNVDDMENLGVVPAQVEVVEPMGSETIIYVLSGQHSLVSRIDAHEKTAPGNYIKLTLIPEKCHFFDAVTELRLN
jgi:multiple sugar transport system ATP-binding protein